MIRFVMKGALFFGEIIFNMDFILRGLLLLLRIEICFSLTSAWLLIFGFRSRWLSIWLIFH